MIFLINSTYTIWLPIYSLSDYKYQSIIYKSLIVIECLLSLLALSFTIITVFIVFSSRAFHRNLNSLIAVIISSWLLSLVSRTLLTPYLIGWAHVTSGDVNSGWWTDDVAGMTQLDDTERPLFLGGFLAWYYMFIMITCLFTMALKRSFASFFIRNYENTSRLYIFILLLLFQHCLVFTMTYICFWNLIHFWPAISFCILINVAAVLIFYLNKHYNSKLIRKLDISQSKKQVCDLTTLPVRFQAKENIRSFDLTIRVIICGFILIISAISCIIFLTFKIFPSLETLLVYCMENIIHLNPLIVCPLLIFSVSTWSKALLKSKAIWIQKITNIDSKNRKTTEQNQQQETDTYFSQLKNSWEMRRK